MKGRCSRCGKPVAVPKPLAGMLLGPSCFAIVCAEVGRLPPPAARVARRARGQRIPTAPTFTAPAADVPEVDARQINLFEAQQ